jgi:hypothetical protein
MPPSAAPYLAPDASATMDVDRAIAQGTRLSAKLHEWERKLEAHGFTRAAIITSARLGAGSDLATRPRWGL